MSSLSVFNEIENIPADNFEIAEPALIRVGSGTQSKFYNLNRYARSTICGNIGIKSKVSSDLYHLDANIWSSIITSKYNDSEYDFSEQKAITFRGKIIEIINKEAYDTATFETFLALIRRNEVISYYNSFDTLVIILKKNKLASSKAVMIVSLNFINGWYSLHSGIISEESYIVFPKADIESSSFVAFMYQFNESFNDFMENINKLSEQTVESFGFDFDENLSLREMYDIIFKDMKCGATLDEDGYLASIPGISTENSKILVDFFNSFGLTFKSLKKLSFLRKTFRSSNITAGQFLKIISAEIQSEALSINGYTFANVCRLCDTEEFDKKIIEDELKK